MFKINVFSGIDILYILSDFENTGLKKRKGKRRRGKKKKKRKEKRK